MMINCPSLWVSIGKFDLFSIFSVLMNYRPLVLGALEVLFGEYSLDKVSFFFRIFELITYFCLFYSYLILAMSV
jgi:hypothetical protein